MKAQVDSLAKLPEAVEREVINYNTKEARAESIKIQYNFIHQDTI